MTANPKNKNLFPFFLLVSALFLGNFFFLEGTLSAETLYVKKSGTKLYQSDTPKSPVVTRLKEGTAVKVVQKAGRFYQVRDSAGKKGWVFKFLLTSKAPQKGGGGGDFLGMLGGEQKMAARESASGSSIRGLSPISEEHAKSKGIPQDHIQAVKTMESFQLPRGVLDDFMKQGRLGEYGTQ